MKATEVLKRIMTELSAVGSVEVKFAQMKLENGTTLEADAFETDNEVFIVNEEERIALPVGEYALEDGRILVVSEEGIIAEVKEIAGEEPVAEEVAEEGVVMESSDVPAPKKIVESTSVETHFAEETEMPAEPVSEDMPVEDQVKAIVLPLIDEIKAELSAIRQEMGYQKEEMSKKEEEVETMKAELSAQSAAKPIKHNPENAQKEQVRMAARRPMTSLDRVMSKLNK